MICPSSPFFQWARNLCLSSPQGLVYKADSCILERRMLFLPKVSSLTCSLHRDGTQRTLAVDSSLAILALPNWKLMAPRCLPHQADPNLQTKARRLKMTKAFLGLKTYQAFFWISCENSDGNPKIGLMCFGHQCQNSATTEKPCMCAVRFITAAMSALPVTFAPEMIAVSLVRWPKLCTLWGGGICVWPYNFLALCRPEAEKAIQGRPSVYPLTTVHPQIIYRLLQRLRSCRTNRKAEKGPALQRTSSNGPCVKKQGRLSASKSRASANRFCIVWIERSILWGY